MLIISNSHIQVAEAVPLDDASVDAVVGTLVLCSVKDVNLALKGSFALQELTSSICLLM